MWEEMLDKVRGDSHWDSASIGRFGVTLTFRFGAKTARANTARGGRWNVERGALAD